jgi:hypothetical protein
MTQIKLVTNADTPWLCFRDPASPLIYFLHSKCASSFYRQLFDKLNWIECTTHDIDWKRDVVFSYIRDPLVKHRTGIIEWFYMFDQIDLLKKNASDDSFFRLLSEAIYLDVHSMSIYEYLGDKSLNVHWIPIDIPARDHRKETIEFLEKYSTISENIKKWILQEPPNHTSTGFKRNCIDKLLKIPPTSLILKSIEYDRYLYDRVTQIPNFEPNNYSLRIQQLLSTGLSQLEAEKIVDREVLFGDYSKWS